MSVIVCSEMVIGTYSKHVIKMFCLKKANHNHFLIKDHFKAWLDKHTNLKLQKTGKKLTFQIFPNKAFLKKLIITTCQLINLLNETGKALSLERVSPQLFLCIRSLCFDTIRFWGQLCPHLLFLGIQISQQGLPCYLVFMSATSVFGCVKFLIIFVPLLASQRLIIQSTFIHC